MDFVGHIFISLEIPCYILHVDLWEVLVLYSETFSISIRVILLNLVEVTTETRVDIDVLSVG